MSNALPDSVIRQMIMEMLAQSQSPEQQNLSGMIPPTDPEGDPVSLTSMINQLQDINSLMADPVMQGAGGTGGFSQQSFAPNVSYEMVDAPEYQRWRNYLNTPNSFEGMIAAELEEGGTPLSALRKIQQRVTEDPQGEVAQIVLMAFPAMDMGTPTGEIDWMAASQGATEIDRIRSEVPQLGGTPSITMPDGTVVPGGEIMEVDGQLVRRTEEPSELAQKFAELGLPSPYDEYTTEDFLPAGWTDEPYQQAATKLDAVRQAMVDAANRPQEPAGGGRRRERSQRLGVDGNEGGSTVRGRLGLPEGQADVVVDENGNLINGFEPSGGGDRGGGPGGMPRVVRPQGFYSRPQPEPEPQREPDLAQMFGAEVPPMASGPQPVSPEMLDLYLQHLSPTARAGAALNPGYMEYLNQSAQPWLGPWPTEAQRDQQPIDVSRYEGQRVGSRDEPLEAPREVIRYRRDEGMPVSGEPRGTWAEQPRPNSISSSLNPIGETMRRYAGQQVGSGGDVLDSGAAEQLLRQRNGTTEFNPAYMAYLGQSAQPWLGPWPTQAQRGPQPIDAERYEGQRVGSRDEPLESGAAEQLLRQRNGEAFNPAYMAYLGQSAQPWLGPWPTQVQRDQMPPSDQYGGGSTRESESGPPRSESVDWYPEGRPTGGPPRVETGEQPAETERTPGRMTTGEQLPASERTNWYPNRRTRREQELNSPTRRKYLAKLAKTRKAHLDAYGAEHGYAMGTAWAAQQAGVTPLQQVYAQRMQNILQAGIPLGNQPGLVNY